MSLAGSTNITLPRWARAKGDLSFTLSEGLSPRRPPGSRRSLSPMPAAAPPEIDIAMLLNQASYALGNRMAVALGETGVTVREYCALWKASEAQLTQRELAEAAWMDKSTVVTTLDALTERGLAERRPAPADRRVKVVGVTKAGQAVVARAHRVVQDVYDELLGGVSARDRDAFLRVLAQLVEGPLATPFHLEAPVRRRKQAATAAAAHT
jgi:MarR family transcriptional regulator, transcriptional regulator for hemolysin